jgi:hypothetical protein
MMTFCFDTHGPERIASSDHDTGFAQRRKVRAHLPVENRDRGDGAAIII